MSVPKLSDGCTLSETRPVEDVYKPLFRFPLSHIVPNQGSSIGNVSRDNPRRVTSYYSERCWIPVSRTETTTIYEIRNRKHWEFRHGSPSMSLVWTRDSVLCSTHSNSLCRVPRPLSRELHVLGWVPVTECESVLNRRVKMNHCGFRGPKSR